MDNQENELDLVELEQEDGTSIQLCVERYFYYNGEEYVLLSNQCGGDGQPQEVEHYVMKVEPLPDENGEEMEEFVPVDDELMEQLIQVVEATYQEDDD